MHLQLPPSLPPSSPPHPKRKNFAKFIKFCFFSYSKLPLELHVFLSVVHQRAKEPKKNLVSYYNFKTSFFFKNAHLSVGVKCKCAIPGCFFFFSFLQPTLISQRINHTQAKVLHTLCCLSFFFFLSRGCFGDPSSKPFLFSFFFFLQIAAFFIPVFDSMSTSKLCMKHASFLLKRETLSKVWPPPPPPQLPPPPPKKKNLFKKDKYAQKTHRKNKPKLRVHLLVSGLIPLHFFESLDREFKIKIIMKKEVMRLLSSSSSLR